MLYEVWFAPAAERDFKKLPRAAQVRLKKHIDALSGDPRPSGVAALSGEEHLYRIRAGDYRVVYAIQDEVLLLLLLRVGHRRDVYRRLP